MLPFAAATVSEFRSTNWDWTDWTYWTYWTRWTFLILDMLKLFGVALDGT